MLTLMYTASVWLSELRVGDELWLLLILVMIFDVALLAVVTAAI